MSRLEVVAAGPYTSVQDLGRFGGQRYGLGPAGAMDGFALALANVLVSQPTGAAAIELGPLPASFKAIGGDVRLALAGARRGMSLRGQPLNPNETFLLADGETVQIRAAAEGVFSYLAIEGGIKAAPVFGSLSMHARSGIGSPYNRALLAGDRLDVGNAGPWSIERGIRVPKPHQGAIRVILGPQDDHFTDEAIATLTSAEWTISATSDRMGYRLEGPVLAHSKGHNIISDGIAFGAMQIPGNGQPLVLLADRGTTGGYPKIANVISADLGRLAQTPVGSKLRFARVSIEEAQRLLRAQRDVIADLPHHVHDLGGGDLSSEFLLAANLAGAVTNAIESTD